MAYSGPPHSLAGFFVPPESSAFPDLQHPPMILHGGFTRRQSFRQSQEASPDLSFALSRVNEIGDTGEIGYLYRVLGVSILGCFPDTAIIHLDRSWKHPHASVRFNRSKTQV